MRKLVPVLEVIFEAIQFAREAGHGLFLVWIIVEVAQFIGVFDEVKQFPLILFPEMDQLVRLGADAVMGAGIMVAGIMIITVIHAGAPIPRALAFE